MVGEGSPHFFWSCTYFEYSQLEVAKLFGLQDLHFNSVQIEFSCLAFEALDYHLHFVTIHDNTFTFCHNS